MALCLSSSFILLPFAFFFPLPLSHRVPAVGLTAMQRRAVFLFVFFVAIFRPSVFLRPLPPTPYPHISLLSAAAAEPAAPAHPLVIRPAIDAPWGGDLADVQKVLDSAAGTLWRYFPDRQLPPILVEPKGGPIVLHRRGQAGELLVRLDTGDRLWAQHAYQFSHELCHILCNFSDGPTANLWFEESLCEMASLFALRQMADTWQTAPPYPNWKSYSASLSGYSDERLIGGKLPPGITLAAWYRDQAERLAAEPTNRERNQIAAVALLPLFEAQPAHWQSIAWLNGLPPARRDAAPAANRRDEAPPDDDNRGPKAVPRALTFAEYLSQWRARAPRGEQPFIDEIARQFELKIAAGRDPVSDRALQD